MNFQSTFSLYSLSNFNGKLNMGKHRDINQKGSWFQIKRPHKITELSKDTSYLQWNDVLLGLLYIGKGSAFLSFFWFIIIRFQIQY